MKKIKIILISFCILVLHNTSNAKLKISLIQNNVVLDTLQKKKDSILFATAATWVLSSKNEEKLSNKNKCDFFYLTITKDNTIVFSYGLLDINCTITEEKAIFEINFLRKENKEEAYINYTKDKVPFKFKIIEANDSNLIIEELDVSNSKVLNKFVFDLDMPIDMVKKSFEIELKKLKVRNMLNKN